jgi:hypothetical protein
LNFFDHLNNLTLYKKEFDPNNDEQRKSYIPFMINRFISMTDVYVPIVNEINQYPDIPKETHYRYFSAVLPKRKHFFKYIKKKKDLNIEDKEKICEYFECSIKDAERFMNEMSLSQIKQIVSIYDKRH